MLLGSILTGVTSDLTIAQVLYCVLTSILCGIVIAVCYRLVTYSSKTFLATIAILPTIVMAVIMMVNGNLGVGVAVAGSFSLIRFRSLPGKASDLAVIFAAMAVGLATGTGFLGFAGLMTLILCVIGFVFAKAPMLEEDQTYRHVKITIPEDLDYATAFDDIFANYTKEHKLESVKTVNLGAMYLVSYDVRLKDVAKEKEMLDALRVRNGNLTISSSLQATIATEL